MNRRELLAATISLPAILRGRSLAPNPNTSLGPLGDSGFLLVERDKTSVMVIDPQSADAIVDIARFGKPGHVRLWMSTAEGDKIVLGRDEPGTGVRWWYWEHESCPQLLTELPSDLTMAGRSGQAGRWFHGAVLAQTSLSVGELRLMTVDLGSGEIVFDQAVDRRLELAATGISSDGSVLAHVQAGNTEVELLIASFGEETVFETFRMDIKDAPVAAAEISLDVTGSDGHGSIAAGLRWGDPDHHEPVVLVSTVTGQGIGAPVRFDGDLPGVETINTM